MAAITHSERKLLTGFALAAFIAWKLMVTIVISKAELQHHQYFAGRYQSLPGSRCPFQYFCRFKGRKVKSGIAARNDAGEQYNF